jgi:probable rRNA maturation factor
MSPDPLVLFETPARGLRRRELQSFALRLQSEVAKGRAFCCLVSTDTHLQRLNQEFRQADYPADVLSFPAPSPDGALGDMAISAQRAVEQGARRGHDAHTEIRILMLHGLLHLLGHDHETDRGRMRRLETRWRKSLGLPTGLIERTK